MSSLSAQDTVDITSSGNRQIKEARKLQRRRYRYQEQAFMVEGVRLIRDALQSQVALHQLFYAPELIAANTDAAALVAQCQAAQIPLLSCTPQVLNSLAETMTPQGVVAVAAIPTLPMPEKPQLALVLDRVRDPGNAGTLIRTAAAAGVDVMVFGPETVDPYNDKVVRSGMGAHFRIPLHICPDWNAIHQLLPACHWYVAEASGVATYDKVDWTSPSALIVGGEAAGASTATAHFAIPLSIPMHSQVESLNAATAGAVILFEAMRQRRSYTMRT